MADDDFDAWANAYAAHRAGERDEWRPYFDDDDNNKDEDCLMCCYCMACIMRSIAAAEEGDANES